jgi:hypothetical protein
MVWSSLLKLIRRAPESDSHPGTFRLTQSAAADAHAGVPSAGMDPNRNNGRRPRLAIFFDAENVSLKWAQQILDQLSRDWDLLMRRAYGSNLASSESTLRKHSIVPVAVLENTKGKNASDLALAVDAAEELFTGISDGLCVVSSDGDFTRLMQRVREKGKIAIVFGTAATPQSLRNACSEFYVLEEPKKAAQPAAPKGKNPKAQPVPAKKEKGAGISTPELPVAQKLSPKTVVVLKEDMRRALRECMAAMGADTMDKFRNYLAQAYPEFSPRKYGFSKLRSLLNHIGAFRIDPVKDLTGEVVNYRLVLPDETDGAGGDGRKQVAANITRREA